MKLEQIGQERIRTRSIPDCERNWFARRLRFARRQNGLSTGQTPQGVVVIVAYGTKLSKRLCGNRPGPMPFSLHD